MTGGDGVDADNETREASDSTEVEDLTDLYREYGNERLPPGQRETDRFPVLSKGGTPSWDTDSFRFEVWGAVDEQLAYSLSEFRELPAVTQQQDFHCVTGWSKFDCTFTGVTFETIIERAHICEDADHVLFHALDGYTTNLSVDECRHEGVLFAYGYENDRLPPDHGGPIRVVTPHKYAYKGAKWVSGVEFLTEK